MPDRRGLATLVAKYGDEARQTDWVTESGKRTAKPGFRAIRATRPEWRLSHREACDLAAWLAMDEPEVVADGEPVTDGGMRVTTEHDGDRLHVSMKGQALVQTLADLIRESDIDLSEWQIARHKINTWTTAMKGDNGPVVVRNWQVEASMEPRRDLEALAALELAGAAYPTPPPPTGPLVSTLIVPDSQHGYRWVGDDRRTLEALHDEAACDIIVQVAARMQPDRIVLLGDMADFAELSTKFPRPPELLGTTQATIRRLHAWIRSIREAAPEADIVYVEGNHEARLRALLVQQAGPIADLAAATETEPAVSVPRLLGLARLGVRYVGPYGQDLYLADARICHGIIVRQRGGATATAVLGEATHTTWYGHVHRAESARRTLHGPSGPRTITAASPGCLCRVDGSVPGVTMRPDWQQGYGIMWQEEGAEYCEVREISRGRTVWDGAVIAGRDTVPVEVPRA